MLATRGLGPAAALTTVGLGPILIEVIPQFTAVDQIGVTDSLDLSRAITTTDTVDVADTLDLGRVLDVADTLGVTDELTAEIAAAGLAFDAVDTVGVADLLGIEADRFITVTDEVAVTDTATAVIPVDAAGIMVLRNEPASALVLTNNDDGHLDLHDTVRS